MGEDLLNIKFAFTLHLLQGDQKVSVHLMIIIQKSGAQRIFDRPYFRKISHSKER